MASSWRNTTQICILECDLVHGVIWSCLFITCFMNSIENTLAFNRFSGIDFTQKGMWHTQCAVCGVCVCVCACNIVLLSFSSYSSYLYILLLIIMMIELNEWHTKCSMVHCNRVHTAHHSMVAHTTNRSHHTPTLQHFGYKKSFKDFRTVCFCYWICTGLWITFTILFNIVNEAFSSTPIQLCVRMIRTIWAVEWVCLETFATATNVRLVRVVSVCAFGGFFFSANDMALRILVSFKQHCNKLFARSNGKQILCHFANIWTDEIRLGWDWRRQRQIEQQNKKRYSNFKRDEDSEREP